MTQIVRRATGHIPALIILLLTLLFAAGHTEAESPSAGGRPNLCVATKTAQNEPQFTAAPSGVSAGSCMAEFKSGSDD